MLEYLDSLNSKARQNFVKKANVNVIKLLVDVLFNVNIGSIPLDPSVVDKLRKYSRQIKSITTVKKSLAQRRRELISKDLFFLRIFPLLLPALIRLIVPKTPPKVQQVEEDGVQSIDPPSG